LNYLFLDRLLLFIALNLAVEAHIRILNAKLIENIFLLIFNICIEWWLFYFLFQLNIINIILVLSFHQHSFFLFHNLINIFIYIFIQAISLLAAVILKIINFFIFAYLCFFLINLCILWFFPYKLCLNRIFSFILFAFLFFNCQW